MAEYWSFTIGDEANTKYRIDVAAYSGDAGDAIIDDGTGDFSSDGMSFSTYDQDHSVNYCPSMYGAWWSKRCFLGCLTCIPSYHTWYMLSGGEYLSASRMMIEPQQ